MVVKCSDASSSPPSSLFLDARCLRRHLNSVSAVAFNSTQHTRTHKHLSGDTESASSVACKCCRFEVRFPRTAKCPRKDEMSSHVCFSTVITSLECHYKYTHTHTHTHTRAHTRGLPRRFFRLFSVDAYSCSPRITLWSSLATATHEVQRSDVVLSN